MQRQTALEEVSVDTAHPAAVVALPRNTSVLKAFREFVRRFHTQPCDLPFPTLCVPRSLPSMCPRGALLCPGRGSTSTLRTMCGTFILLSTRHDDSATLV